MLQTLPKVEPSQLKSVVHVAKSRCAFINFVDRATAEAAAQAWANGIEIDGERISVKWGRSKPVKEVGASASAGAGPSAVLAGS